MKFEYKEDSLTIINKAYNGIISISLGDLVEFTLLNPIGNYYEKFKGTVEHILMRNKYSVWIRIVPIENGVRANYHIMKIFGDDDSGDHVSAHLVKKDNYEVELI